MRMTIRIVPSTAALHWLDRKPTAPPRQRSGDGLIYSKGRGPAGCDPWPRTGSAAFGRRPEIRRRVPTMTLITGLMPAFGAWLKSTRLTELSVWIGNTPLSTFLNQNNWITPTLQSVHIMAIAL